MLPPLLFTIVKLVTGGNNKKKIQFYDTIQLYYLKLKALFQQEHIKNNLMVNHCVAASLHPQINSAYKEYFKCQSNSKRHIVELQ